MEALILATQVANGKAYDVRTYRSVSKLLDGIIGGWIRNFDDGYHYQVTLFTDHEGWVKEFSQDEFEKTIDELVLSFETVQRIEYMADGVTIKGEHPDYKANAKAWKLQATDKLNAVLHGAIS
jgi:hypothetical protein